MDGSADAVALLAIAALRRGDRDGAWTRFQHCAALPHPTGLHGMAALCEDEDPDRSWALMEEALADGAVPALTRIARIARLRGDDRLCLELLTGAARLGDADAMYDLAHAAADAGDVETSRRWYALAVERESGCEWPIERGAGYGLL